MRSKRCSEGNCRRSLKRPGKSAKESIPEERLDSQVHQQLSNKLKSISRQTIPFSSAPNLSIEAVQPSIEFLKVARQHLLKRFCGQEMCSVDLALAVAQICYFISISPTEAENVVAEILLVGAGFAEGGGIAEDEGDVVGAMEGVEFVAGDKHGERLPFGFLAGVLVSDSRGRCLR
jgi:hypothetical protein